MEKDSRTNSAEVSDHFSLETSMDINRIPSTFAHDTEIAEIEQMIEDQKI